VQRELFAITLAKRASRADKSFTIFFIAASVTNWVIDKEYAQRPASSMLAKVPTAPRIRQLLEETQGSFQAPFASSSLSDYS
jgi:hypothetical protein